ncbi:hypothetical protein L218DRAFT_948656 [Marasmius fiardii PR-910]|nr:hypothetical protein L218DRAFT_948656 [Marasmius fiardii PR-910]
MLPKDTKYCIGTLKERYTKYFEDNPSKKTWVLDTSTLASPTSSPQYAGITTASHTNYTLAGLQGPSMIAGSSGGFEGLNLAESNMLKELLLKMETHQAAKEKAGKAQELSTSSDPESSQPQSKQSAPIQVQHPSKPPQPIIGKIPSGYEPPSEQTIATA